jgi:hypothetical protein
VHVLEQSEGGETFAYSTIPIWFGASWSGVMVLGVHILGGLLGGNLLLGSKLLLGHCEGSYLGVLEDPLAVVGDRVDIFGVVGFLSLSGAGGGHLIASICWRLIPSCFLHLGYLTLLVRVVSGCCIFEAGCSLGIHDQRCLLRGHEGGGIDRGGHVGHDMGAGIGGCGALVTKQLLRLECTASLYGVDQVIGLLLLHGFGTSRSSFWNWSRLRTAWIVHGGIIGLAGDVDDFGGNRRVSSSHYSLLTWSPPGVEQPFAMLLILGVHPFLGGHLRLKNRGTCNSVN